MTPLERCVADSFNQPKASCHLKKCLTTGLHSLQFLHALLQTHSYNREHKNNLLFNKCHSNVFRRWLSPSWVLTNNKPWGETSQIWWTHTLTCGVQIPNPCPCAVTPLTCTETLRLCRHHLEELWKSESVQQDVKRTLLQNTEWVMSELVNIKVNDSERRDELLFLNSPAPILSDG